MEWDRLWTLRRLISEKKRERKILKKARSTTKRLNVWRNQPENKAKNTRSHKWGHWESAAKLHCSFTLARSHEDISKQTIGPRSCFAAAGLKRVCWMCSHVVSSSVPFTGARQDFLLFTESPLSSISLPACELRSCSNHEFRAVRKWCFQVSPHLLLCIVNRYPFYAR